MSREARGGRGPVEGRRRGARGRPSRANPVWSRSRSSTTSALRSKKTNLEAKDDAALAVPPTPHNSRTSLVEASGEDPQLQAQREMIERAAERNKDLAAALEHANSRLAEVENERKLLVQGRRPSNTRKNFLKYQRWRRS